jgi:hypothetical protein
VSQSSYEPPTGPLRGQGQVAAAQPPPPAHPGAGGSVAPAERNVRRDLIAAGLLLVAGAVPWNLYFGAGIPDSKLVLFAALGAVTLLSLIGIVAPVGRLRLLLNVPYWLLVLGFIGYDAFETIRSGGGIHLSGGVGPGAWLGMAGSVLSVQPVVTRAAAGDQPVRAAKIIGYASIVGATLSTGYNLFWRVRFALHDTSGAGFGKQNIAVIVTATVYGLVALAGVLVASRWLLKNTKAAQLSLVALGASTLVAGPLVWFLPVGREIDAFHGIAQNTSTAGVGYEGYLVWAVAAAIFVPRVLPGYRNGGPDDAGPWWTAARKGLALIIVWCVGSAMMRITDYAVAVSLDYPYSRYDSMTLAGFDLVTAAVAIWLRIKLGKSPGSPRLIRSLGGLLVTFGVARVVMGVMLAPRFQEPPTGGPSTHPVYGNNLAQQITSTFDVTLCGVALAVLFAAIVAGRLSGRRPRRRRRRPVHAARPGGPVKAPPPSAAATSQMTLPRTGPVPQLAGSGAGAGAPRIFRGDDSATRQIQLPPPPAQGPPPKIFRPPQNPN